MRLLVMTDTHIRGTTPGRRLDDFKKTLLVKLTEIEEIACKEEVDYILHAGDLFNRPDTAPSVVGDFIRVLRRYPVPIYLVAGNHDLYGHNPDTLHRTMLGLLVASGVVNLVTKDPIILKEDGVKVQLTGKSFDYSIDKRNSTGYSVKKLVEVDYAIHLAHGMLLERPIFDNIDYTLIEDVDTEADITIAGHYHLGFGLKEFNDRYFLNPGALVRMDAHIKEMKRIPKIAIIELTKNNINIRFKELASAKDSKDVLDRSAIEEDKFREKKLAQFVRQVKATEEFKTFKINEILNKIASNEDLDKQVIEESFKRLAIAQENLGQGGE